MMNDVYMEYMIKPPKSGKRKALIALTIALGAAVTLALLLVICVAAIALIGTRLGSFAFSIGLVLIAFAWYGVYLLVSMQNIEYEYTLTNSAMDVDKIMSKRGRKRVVSFDFTEISVCANIEDTEHNHNYINITAEKTLDLTGDKKRGNVYFVDFSGDNGRTRVLFQPTSKMINEIKKFNPRNVFVYE